MDLVVVVVDLVVEEGVQTPKHWRMFLEITSMFGKDLACTMNKSRSP
jgi:hypothetical protein